MSAGSWVFILEDFTVNPITFHIYNYSSSYQALIEINHSISFTDSDNNIFNKDEYGTSNENFQLFQNYQSVSGSPFSDVTTVQNFLNNQSLSSIISVTNNEGDTITLIPVGTRTEIKNNNNTQLFILNAGDWLFIDLDTNTNTFGLYKYTSDFKAGLTPNYTDTWTDSSNHNFTHLFNGTSSGDFRLYQNDNQVTDSPFTNVDSARSFLNSQSTNSDVTVNNNDVSLTLIPVAKETEVRNNNNDTLFTTPTGSWVFIHKNNNDFSIYNYTSDYRASLLRNYTNTITENGNDYNYVSQIKNMKELINLLKHLEMVISF